tara:strand:- start:1511 stop:2761 length:1251 start_codon:yes stop_codon:yes gene_type:complete
VFLKRINSNLFLQILLLFSALPSFIFFSPFSKSININLSASLYIIFTLIREVSIILIGSQIILRFFQGILKKKFSKKLIIILLPILSFLYSIFNDFEIIYFLVGLRFYILSILPVLLLEGKIFVINRQIILNIDRISYFYLGLNLITLAESFSSKFVAFGNYSTFLGQRFPFLYEDPIVAAMMFGSLALYYYFRIFYSRLSKEKIIFLLLIYLLLYFSLFTGGRAGLSIIFLITIFSTIQVLFPNFKTYFQNSKQKLNRIVALLILFVFAFFSIMIASIDSISARPGLLKLINEEGIYSSRGSFLISTFNQRDKQKLFFGSPGVGTNTIVRYEENKEIIKPADSYITSSILSFGIFGLILVLMTLNIFLNLSFSPIMSITFLVYAFSQSLPELIFPWILLVITLSLSSKMRMRGET